MFFLINILKGFIIGIAKIMPGVSGALLAISLGVYENAIEAISSFFKNPIKYFKYLFSLFIGVFLAVILLSKLILFCINNYYLPTMLLFIGLIIGGMFNLFKKIEIKKMKLFHFLIIIFSFLIVVFLYFKNDTSITIFQNNFISYFIIGFIDAFTMIVPGISGTAIMMVLNCYHMLLGLLSSLISINSIIINLNLIFPYLLGIVLTIILLSKLINYLIKNNQNLIYSFIIGFSLSSILVLFLMTFKNNYNFVTVIISLVLLLLGFIIGKRLN